MLRLPLSRLRDHGLSFLFVRQHSALQGANQVFEAVRVVDSLFPLCQHSGYGLLSKSKMNRELFAASNANAESKLQHVCL